MRYMMTTLTLLLLGMGVTASAREEENPLPDAKQVKTISIKFHHAELDDVEFTATPDDWKAIRTTLLPATRDRSPSDREWFGTVRIVNKDGRPFRVELYSTSKEPGAFAAGATFKKRVYYRGGSTAKLVRALNAAFEKFQNTGKGEQGIEGVWEYVLISRGRALEPPSEEEEAAPLTISEETMSRTVVGIPVITRYSLDVTETPKRIDMFGKDNGQNVVSKGVYVLKDNILILKTSEPGQPRPRSISFKPDEGGGVEYTVLGKVRTATNDDESSFVTVECPGVQDGDQLLKQWRGLPSRIREKIESEIVVGRRLGLSSTGVVQLIGVYKQPEGQGDKEKAKRLFHLRQTDRFGARLFWSTLVNTEDETYRILFHINDVRGRDASWLKLGDG